MDKIICILGPTASGKTALSVRLAQRYDGEVISCDSMQVYRGMDIGTAKPTEEEMGGVVHHMLSVADPNEAFSVGKYVEMASPILQDVLARGKTAIICGGTGLYMDSLMQGQQFAPQGDEALRKELEHRADTEGMEALLRELQTIDPATAQRLHLLDRKRILRALEVYYATGEPISVHNERTASLPPQYAPLRLGLWFSNRKELYERIDKRVLLMLEQGLLQEIQGLLDSGADTQSTAMQAIGYKEFLLYLEGKESLDDAVKAVQQGSRRYAKRQMTWFHRRDDICWLDRSILTQEADVFSAARQELTNFLG
ncbi:MAG: tRNA (adenosine(37)-N6)-dimethylallyltransferase MiaA [Oscillospiraceae bacterium]|nr:tRNA (adenosine(37)-N6)-dimethylallyltransferase MiaA [Oscillospiraceae bacterium]